MLGHGKVKGHNEVFSHFGDLWSARRAAKISTSSKVLGTCPRRILNEYEGHTYNGQGQGQVSNGHYKIKKNTDVSCNTCFLSNFHADIDGDSHLNL